MYFIALTLVGGLLFLFLAMGWSSYKDKKIPEKGILFRWFVAGLVSVGLGAYAWIFGAGGDVGEALKSMGGALEVDSLLKMVQSAGGAATEEVKKEGDGELTVGMPTF